MSFVTSLEEIKVNCNIYIEEAAWVSKIVVPGKKPSIMHDERQTPPKRIIKENKNTLQDIQAEVTTE